MYHSLTARLWRAPIRIAAVCSLAILPTSLTAQAARDSVAKADSARRIERVLISAFRAGDAAPIAQKTIGREVIAQRHFGQDVPLLLQGASPSLTAQC